MKNILKHKLRFIPVLLLLLVGCEDLDLVPENKFTDANYFLSISRTQNLLNTAYSQMQNSSRFLYNEGLSDNAYNGRGDNEGVASIAAGIHDASLARFKAEFGDRYAGIKTCNLILENIDKAENADPALIERMKAEARFLRAFQHFQLTTWFGDIPLVSKDPSLEEAKTITRTSHAEVVAFILSELDAIIDVLPNDYVQAEKGKITAGAALALKARVLLYDSRWQEVVETTERIMSGSKGQYALFPSYEGVFLAQNEYSSEVILSLQYVPVDRMWTEFIDMAPLSVAGARLNGLAPTQELVDSYLMLNGKAITEAGSGYDENNPYVNRDPRLTGTVVYDGYQWKDTNTSAARTIYIKPGSFPGDDKGPDEYESGSSRTTTGYYMRKYYDTEHLNDLKSGLNLILFRYADVLLMNAEAKAELGQLDNTAWNATIGALRTRAGFTSPEAINFNAGLSQTALRDVVRNERRSELGMEGLRIFDIRRWKIAEDVLNGYAHGAKFGVPTQDNGYLRVNLRTFDPAKHYLWPIPRDERLINSNLTQNPGY